MKIFLDTADIDEIHAAARWGVLDGVTTNPSLFAKAVNAGSYESILAKVCAITPGPVSAEVVASDVDGMLSEGRAFAKIASNIVVKIPMSEEGLEAISTLAKDGIATNCTPSSSVRTKACSQRRPAPASSARSSVASTISTKTVWPS